MDIASLSMDLATADLQNSVSIAMLSKTLDTADVLSEGISEILDASAMEQSVTPYLGGNIDIRI